MKTYFKWTFQVNSWRLRYLTSQSILQSKAPIVSLSKNLYSYCLVLVGSSLERIPMWFHNQTKTSWRSYGKLTQTSPLVNYRQTQTKQYSYERKTCFLLVPLHSSMNNKRWFLHLKMAYCSWLRRRRRDSRLYRHKRGSCPTWCCCLHTRIGRRQTDTSLKIWVTGV